MTVITGLETLFTISLFSRLSLKTKGESREVTYLGSGSKGGVGSVRTEMKRFNFLFDIIS
jgi:hypothetical protein